MLEGTPWSRLPFSASVLGEFTDPAAVPVGLRFLEISEGLTDFPPSMLPSMMVPAPLVVRYSVPTHVAGLERLAGKESRPTRRCSTIKLSPT